MVLNQTETMYSRETTKSVAVVDLNVIKITTTAISVIFVNQNTCQE